jgi:hypothetical protein
MLLKIDPDEDDDPYLTMYMQGQDEGVESLMGTREEEEADEDLITNPQGIPKPDVQLEGEGQLKPSIQEMIQHAIEVAQADAMGGAEVAKPPIDSRYQRYLEADKKLRTSDDEDDASTE